MNAGLSKYRVDRTAVMCKCKITVLPVISYFIQFTVSNDRNRSINRYLGGWESLL